jgi:hypothetical protein
MRNIAQWRNMAQWLRHLAQYCAICVISRNRYCAISLRVLRNHGAAVAQYCATDSQSWRNIAQPIRNPGAILRNRCAIDWRNIARRVIFVAQYDTRLRNNIATYCAIK